MPYVIWTIQAFLTKNVWKKSYSKTCQYYRRFGKGVLEIESRSNGWGF